jgi:ketosteroid isomerase-like protein
LKFVRKKPPVRIRSTRPFQERIVLERDKIVEFSRHWINTWNAGDIAEIMSHYAKDVEFSSPLVIQRLNRTSGKLAGADELRTYFEVSLHGGIKRRFSLESVAIGSDAFVINYNTSSWSGCLGSILSKCQYGCS